MLTKKELALKNLLNIEKGELRAFPEFCIVLSKESKDGLFFIYWKKGFHKEEYGCEVRPEMLNHPIEIVILNDYECHWAMYPQGDDWDSVLYDKVMDELIRLSEHKGRPLKLRYYNKEQDISKPFDKRVLFKPRYKNITNKNLCKIDGLNLKGDVDYIHGIIMTDRKIDFDYRNDNRVRISTYYLLDGVINRRLYGDISGVIGTISDELIGDISGITGDVTNVVGNCTGIKLHIRQRVDKKTNISTLTKCPLSGKLRLLSNEDSEKSFNAYRKLAHCTLGLTKDERNAIDRPTKIKPPFNIDKWGRYYTEKNGCTWVYSINPADIMFLKEIGPLNSCFCITSQSANGRWHAAMRTLMALNCTNKNLACIFKISNEEPTRRMRMFKDLDFVWFKPIEGGFIQYNENGEGRQWSRLAPNLDIEGHFLPLRDEKSIRPIYGHDGINLGHDRQKRMGYLELFIKDEHSWVQDKTWIKESENIITNNHWDICYDENWVELNRCGDAYENTDIPEDSIIQSFIKEAKMAKEIIDGIKV